MLTALNFLSISWAYMQPSSNHEILLPLFVIPLSYTCQIHAWIIALACAFTSTSTPPQLTTDKNFNNQTLC